ncbi:MAG: DegV family protein [Chloroflexi bacterium]|nr:DegV family protein [Chloroflexota bacterium]
MDEHRITVMTDSTCDIPPELARELGIRVVPLYVLFGDEHLRDGIDVDSDGFYARLSADPEHPKSSQPTPADFQSVIEASGSSEVVCIHISNRLSGTIASATAAQELVSASTRVHVVDSMSVSMGLGLQVLAAARARNAGGSVEEIIAAAERARNTLQVVFTVDTLEYLHRGGRIGAAAKLLGTALQLKPVLAIPTASGQIEAVERVRSRRRSLARLVEYSLEQIDTSRPIRAAVMQGVCPDDAHWVLGELTARADVAEAIYTNVTPVVGTHGGPGVLGIALCHA